jgi:signal transduction histidine kinase
MLHNESQTLEQLVSKLSHDLRTPLTSSKLNLDMLLNGVAGTLTDQQKNMLKDIDEAQDKILELIQTFRNGVK